MVEKFGSGAFACVLDSYDYARALSEILPSIATEKLAKGGFMVLRPDSGDPVEVVLMALRAGEKVFGADVNDKGYKVLRGCGVIQGDAVTYDSLRHILAAVKQAGYAANNVAFGMGGGLLQRMNRDTMGFATKLSHIVYPDGSDRNVMKTPKEARSKTSLPGEFYLKRDEQQVGQTASPYQMVRLALSMLMLMTMTTTVQHIKVYPKPHELDAPAPRDNLFEVVYDHGPVADHRWDTFNVVRERVASEWRQAPKRHDPISSALYERIVAVEAAQAQNRTHI
ncbi:nicotinate phosphoribosyltransferase family-domain-containing protein [Syncephalis pseudoplumigaleata]|uniref:Nicotinamide phosphoribosyltransferase n=1 Tax=Syncephalis pseudoplumigaleata TaxID=1712513 RepID=A0A4V1J1B7_9FUNG|nr:nicotinate phosphoribosyltransferase family-domain-containing protein [Syncephalis pseudoplumigaleata]|eukprot:RKP24499.1 nicotinate phosphoribosyltransferase family-domain-containing protein [Syncephalis pseudoplumigaleata]